MGQHNCEKGYVLVLGQSSREVYIELIVLFDFQVLAGKKLIWTSMNIFLIWTFVSSKEYCGSMIRQEKEEQNINFEYLQVCTNASYL